LVAILRLCWWYWCGC